MADEASHRHEALTAIGPPWPATYSLNKPLTVIGLIGDGEMAAS